MMRMGPAHPHCSPPVGVTPVHIFTKKHRRLPSHKTPSPNYTIPPVQHSLPGVLTLNAEGTDSYEVCRHALAWLKPFRPRFRV